MIYSRHMGSQSKPFTRLSLNHASQQDSVHIKAAHGSPKRPQKSPSPVHSIKWEFPPERKGLDSHVASGILIKQKCSKTFSVSIHGKISWIRFIKTDIFIQQTHSKIKANFSSKPGGAGAGGRREMRSWQQGINFPQSSFFRSIRTYGIGSAFNSMSRQHWPTNQATKSCTDGSGPVPERHLVRMAGQPDNERLPGGH